MKRNIIDFVWGICLIILGLGALIISLNNVFDLDIPDSVKRPIGIVDLITLPLLAFTTVKKMQKKNG